MDDRGGGGGRGSVSSGPERSKFFFFFLGPPSLFGSAVSSWSLRIETGLGALCGLLSAIYAFLALFAVLVCFRASDI